MKKVLVTGSSGLIGSAVSEKFAIMGWEVYGVDNYLRSYFLNSKEAETKGQIQEIQEKYSNIKQFNYNINELKQMETLIKDI